MHVQRSYGVVGSPLAQAFGMPMVDAGTGPKASKTGFARKIETDCLKSCS